MKRGFISTSMVISVIVLAMAIVMVMITTRETNSILETTIADNVRTRLVNAKVPNCMFGAAPYMVIYENKASAIIIMTCSHIDGFMNDITSEVIKDNINDFFTKYKFDDDSPIVNNDDLEISLIKAAPYPNESQFQFRIVLELTSKHVGEYYIQLEKEKFKTTAGVDNIEIISRKIIVVEEEI